AAATRSMSVAASTLATAHSVDESIGGQFDEPASFTSPSGEPLACSFQECAGGYTEHESAVHANGGSAVFYPAQSNLNEEILADARHSRDRQMPLAAHDP